MRYSEISDHHPIERYQIIIYKIISNPTQHHPMPKHAQLLFLLFTLLYAANATGNPGILVSVPFPLNVPALPLGLPLSIDNIVISNLELTNISVRELDYKWSFDVKKAEVSISFAQISFDWVFKKEKGTGLFR